MSGRAGPSEDGSALVTSWEHERPVALHDSSFPFAVRVAAADPDAEEDIDDLDDDDDDDDDLLDDDDDLDDDLIDLDDEFDVDEDEKPHKQTPGKFDE